MCFPMVEPHSTGPRTPTTPHPPATGQQLVAKGATLRRPCFLTKKISNQKLLEKLLLEKIKFLFEKFLFAPPRTLRAVSAP